MARSGKPKFYAVKVGRGAPQIFESWDKAKDSVTRFPGAVHRAFTSRTAAEEWLAIPAPHNPFREVAQQRYEDRKPVPPRNGGPSRDLPGGYEADPPDEGPTFDLSEDQQHVLQKVKAGESVFFTGAAGTGKSVLLREIIRWCRGEGHKQLAVTASTGIAGVNIGGSTLHSWAGIGLGLGPWEDLVGMILGQARRARLQDSQRKEKATTDGEDSDPEQDSIVADGLDKRGQRSLHRWQRVEVLIIDEISMIDGALFDKLERIARRLRASKRPFGGIQLVLSGDFFQLPPVDDRKSKGGSKELLQPPLFAFEAKSWEKCVGRPITLRKVFRQKEESFVHMLNAMRLGLLDGETIAIFRALSREVPYDDGLTPTELFATRVEVETANNNRLSKIDSEPSEYLALDEAGFDDQDRRVGIDKMDTLLERLMAPKILQLKVGAQVMLIKNLVQGELVNGSIGIVVRFQTAREALSEGAQLGVPEGPPNASNGTGEPSRIGDAAIPENVREHIREAKKWPVVRFGKREVLCVPAQFDVNTASGVLQARRSQVPLILAWALSIHKSQGQTLERVKVNMKRVFEKGQAYVALSRATSLERLQVLNFDPAKVQVHQTVLEWMKEHGAIPLPGPVVADTQAEDLMDHDVEFWGNGPR